MFYFLSTEYYTCLGFLTIQKEVFWISRIRDYLQDKFVDENQTRFSDLTLQDQANFKTVQLPCQWITIERNDSPDIIADMFCRLNTSAKPLSQGELFKAHGHRKDIWELELAKKMSDATELPTITELERLWFELQ